MKTKGKLIARILLGLMLVVFGLNGFLNFIPIPPGPEEAGNFMGALAQTGYLLTLVKVLEIIAGALILSGKYVRAALTMVTPVMLNAFLMHLFLDPAGIGGSLLCFALIIYLITTEWEGFKHLLKA